MSLRANASRFLFPDDSDGWLAILRIGLGLHLALYALSLRSDWSYFLGASGSGGALGREISESMLLAETPLVPRISWFVDVGARIGLSETAVLTLAWACLLAAGWALAVGLFSRSAAIAGWLLHLCASKSGGFLVYGVDRFMTIGLFYLMLSPLPDRLALDHRWRGKALGRPELLGFFRRVLQVHCCLIYFFGGLAKSLGSGWWNGDNLWRALTRPPFDLVDPALLVHFKGLVPVAGIGVVLLETCYPFFIVPKRTRLAWLIGIVVMHVGIGLMMGMYMFALVMIVLNVAAWAPGLSLPSWLRHLRLRKRSRTTSDRVERDGQVPGLQRRPATDPDRAAGEIRSALAPGWRHGAIVIHRPVRRDETARDRPVPSARRPSPIS